MPRTNVVGTTAPPGSGAQRCAQPGERKHRTDSTSGRATTPSNAIDRRRLTALCADLVGSDICTAPGIIARSYAPVLALCRRLIQFGKGPKITQISDRRIGITAAHNRTTPMLPPTKRLSLADLRSAGERRKAGAP